MSLHGHRAPPLWAINAGLSYRYLYYRSVGWGRGKIHRVDYGNPKSLAIKSGYAHAVGARGVGMWTADLIDYNESKAAQGFWDAFEPFVGPS